MWAPQGITPLHSLSQSCVSSERLLTSQGIWSTQLLMFPLRHYQKIQTTSTPIFGKYAESYGNIWCSGFVLSCPGTNICVGWNEGKNCIVLLKIFSLFGQETKLKARACMARFVSIQQMRSFGVLRRERLIHFCINVACIVVVLIGWPV